MSTPRPSAASRSAAPTCCRYPTAELAWGLILALAPPHPAEDAAIAPRPLADPTLGNGLNGKTLGILGLGRLGSQVARVGKAFGMKIIAWSQNLTDAKAAEHGARLRQQGRAVRHERRHHHPSRAEPALARPRRRGRPRADEADRLSRQHLARADRRRGGARSTASRRAASPAPASMSTTPSRCPRTTRSWRSTTPS